MFSLILQGRRSITELHKCRDLRVSAKFFQNGSAFSNSCSYVNAADVRPRDGQNGQNFSVSYLVDTLGLTTKLAESVFGKVKSEGKGNPDSVLSLLRSHGFTDSQISSIVTVYPGLLILDAEKSIGPKLKFLQSKGASSSELTDILSKVPKILGMKVGQTISNYYDFAKEIVEDDKSLNYQPQGRPQENKFRNVLALRELGVPQRLLFTLLASNLQIDCGKEKFEESLKKVVEMGFDPTTPKFLQALQVLCGMSDKVTEEKVNVYKRLGFAEGNVWELFSKFPYFLALSEKNILNSIETFLGLGLSRDEFMMMVKRFPPSIGYSAKSVKKKIEFLVKKMNWPIKVIVSNPSVIGYSMEKRIVPRYNLIKALLSKRLIGNELPPMLSVLVCSDELFLRRYVRKHDDDKELVAELMTIFTGKKN